jgi:hypothetical protein
MAAAANEGARMTTSSGAGRPHGRSLGWTMAVIAIIAVDLAVLRAYFPAIPNPGLVLTVVVLEVGLFRGASRRGEARAFWVGFEVSGWLYVLICSIFVRTAWRLSRALFERIFLGGRPILFPDVMNRAILFAGVLQLVISLTMALAFGLLARSAWRRTRPTAPRETPLVQD